MKIKKMLFTLIIAVSIFIPVINGNISPVMAFSDSPIVERRYEEETLTHRFNLEEGTIIQFDAKIRRNGNSLYYVSANNWDAYYTTDPQTLVVGRLTFTSISGRNIYMNIYAGRNGNNYLFRCVYNYDSGGRVITKEPY